MKGIHKIRFAKKFKLKVFMTAKAFSLKLSAVINTSRKGYLF